MNEGDSDIEEDDILELSEDDVEEVIVDECLEDGDEEEGPGSDVENHFIMDRTALSQNDGQIEVEYEADLEPPVRDDADFVFEKHTGPVFCCAIDPKNGNLAVTGGQDDMAYVWEIHQGQILFECTGHKDSVTMASFNYDGSYVATGDMRGCIQVWKISSRTMVWSDSVDDLSWLQWHHGTNVLLCAVNTGDIFMWRVPSGECKVIPGHATSPDCGVIMPDGRRVAVGYTDGVVKVFELNSMAGQGSVTVGEGQSPWVICIDAHSDNNIIASGTADGKVTLLKTQPLKVLWSFCCTEQHESNTVVECVGFSKDPSLPLLAAGTLRGVFVILDFAKQVVRHRIREDTGISRLVWDRHSPTVLVGSLDASVRIYDARSGVCRKQLLGHRNSVLDIALSTDGHTLLSSSDDHTCRVYAVSSPGQ